MNVNDRISNHVKNLEKEIQRKDEEHATKVNYYEDKIEAFQRILNSKDEEIKQLRTSAEIGASMFSDMLNKKSEVHKEVEKLTFELKETEKLHNEIHIKKNGIISELESELVKAKEMIQDLVNQIDPTDVGTGSSPCQEIVHVYNKATEFIKSAPIETPANDIDTPYIGKNLMNLLMEGKHPNEVKPDGWDAIQIDTKEKVHFVTDQDFEKIVKPEENGKKVSEIMGYNQPEESKEQYGKGFKD